MLRAAGRGASPHSPMADGEVTALCHLGSNLVPSGSGCEALRRPGGEVGSSDADRRGRCRLRHCGTRRAGSCREPGSTARTNPCTRSPSRRRTADTGLRPATVVDLDLLVPSCAAAHHEELGVDPLRRDPSGFRWRTRAQVEEGRSWLWVEDGVIRFKAEASAWTPRGGAARSRCGPIRLPAGRGSRPGRSVI